MSEPTPRKSVRVMWRDAVAPAWEAVPPKMHALFHRVCREAAGVEPGFQGHMAWPESSLKDDYDAAETPLLAGAALVMSLYGLWHPERTFAEKGGGGWAKFVDYADQTLRVRHGLPAEPPKYEEQWGMGLVVLNGQLRIDLDVRERHGWYVYLGLATANHVAAARAVRWPRFPGRDEHPSDRGHWVSRCRPLAEQLAKAQRPGRGALAAMFDIGAVPGYEPAELNVTPKEAPGGSTQGAEGGTSQPEGQSRLF